MSSVLHHREYTETMKELIAEVYIMTLEQTQCDIGTLLTIHA